MRLGELEVLPVLTGSVDVPPELILSRRPHERWLTPEGLLPTQMGGYLVLTGERRVLVDTGYTPDTLVQGLAEIGWQPSDITDVVLTHLHFDHIGGASDGVTATFP